MDASQEMVALGICNILGSFVQAMPTTGSFSRSIFILFAKFAISRKKNSKDTLRKHFLFQDGCELCKWGENTDGRWEGRWQNLCILFLSFGILLLHLYIISFYVFVFVCIHFSTIIFVFCGNADGRWDCPGQILSKPPNDVLSIHVTNKLCMFLFVDIQISCHHHQEFTLVV